MLELKEKRCLPCEKGTDPMNSDQIQKTKKQLSIGWQVFENKKLYKEFPFENFRQVMAFANDVAAIANEENHHPDLCLHFAQAEITLSTHAIGGLSENDFIMAAKIDEI